MERSGLGNVYVDGEGTLRRAEVFKTGYRVQLNELDVNGTKCSQRVVCNGDGLMVENGNWGE